MAQEHWCSGFQPLPIAAGADYGLQEWLGKGLMFAIVVMRSFFDCILAV